MLVFSDSKFKNNIKDEKCKKRKFGFDDMKKFVSPGLNPLAIF